MKALTPLKQQILKYLSEEVFKQYGKQSPYESNAALLSKKFYNINPVLFVAALKLLENDKSILIFNYQGKSYFILPEWKKHIKRKDRQHIK